MQNVRCQFKLFKILYPGSNPKRLKVQMKFLKKKSKITNYSSGCDGAHYWPLDRILIVKGSYFKSYWDLICVVKWSYLHRKLT